MDKEFKGARAYITIPIGIERDVELLKKYPRAILLMGEIFTLLNTTGDFYMSNKRLSEILATTTKSINDWLKILEDKKLIKRIKVIDEKTKAIKGRKITAGPNLEKLTLLGWTRESYYPSNVEVSGVCTPTLHKKSSLKKHIKNHKNKSTESKSPHPPYKEIISYLNEKTGKTFKFSSKSNQSLINARFNEGFSLEDFKQVINKKVADWGNSDKMNQYLRPRTLFGTKFEDYLNEKVKNIPSKPNYDFTRPDWQANSVPDIADDNLPF